MLAPAAVAADPPPDFSGTWTLDAARSENPGVMSALRRVVVITQSPTALLLKEQADFQDQKSARQVHCDLTGAPTKNPASMGGTAESSAKWTDGKLVVTWTTGGAVAGTKSVRGTRAAAGRAVVMVYGKTE